ncbi:MAG: purine-nucleoside phosphorylase [Gammaproteobacteria bacterium]|nr:purine-nucleoside phosphorylase [Gammaproteobacteria bacterium]
MGMHIDGKMGDVAETVLMPGDPARAKLIAETYLTDVTCYSSTRQMFGFTGMYQGKRVSVQGSGMGMPSISIYAHELIHDFGAQKIIRVGSCGAFRPEIELGDIILAQSASTDSNMNSLVFKGMDYAPTASFDLLLRAYQVAQEKGIKVKVGNILSSDSFYGDDPEEWKLWARHNVLAVEMEAAALFTLAAKFDRQALAILTTSDNLATEKAASIEERETTFEKMATIALALAD